MERPPRPPHRHNPLAGSHGCSGWAGRVQRRGGGGWWKDQPAALGRGISEGEGKFPYHSLLPAALTLSLSNPSFSPFLALIPLNPFPLSPSPLSPPQILETLSQCVQLRWPVLLVGRFNKQPFSPPLTSITYALTLHPFSPSTHSCLPSPPMHTHQHPLPHFLPPSLTPSVPLPPPSFIHTNTLCPSSSPLIHTHQHPLLLFLPPINTLCPSSPPSQAPRAVASGEWRAT